MKFRTVALAVLAVVVSNDAARAHDFIEGAGALNGFLHPLLVPSHAISLLAFGLMTGQQSKPHRLFLTMLFPAILIGGILAIIFATFSVDAVPLILIACGAAASLLTALAMPLPVVIPAAILVAGGSALIFDSVPSVISRQDTILALAATAFSTTLLLGLAAYAVAALTREWQRIGVRILGSWIAASGMLILELRLTQ